MPLMEVSASLCSAPASAPAEQLPVYLTCSAAVRRGDEPFQSELRVRRVGEEEGSTVPDTVLFPITREALFEADGQQLSWWDRARSNRYVLDVDELDAANALGLAIGRALYETAHTESADGVPDEQLVTLLGAEEPVKPSDLLKASGELIRIEAELHMYDVENEIFRPVVNNAVVTLNSAVARDDGSRAYLMMVFKKDTGRSVMEVEVTNSITAEFHAQVLSMVWVLSMDPETDLDEPEEIDGEYDPSTQQCFSIKFNAASDFRRMQNQFSVCLYEVNNQATMDSMKLKEGDREYVMDAAREEYEPMDVDATSDTEEDPVASRTLREDHAPSGRQSLGVLGDGLVNSQLALAANNDRTFVVRGDMLGVLSHGGAEGVDFRTTVNFDDPDKKGKTFRPSKILLHEKDTSMLVLDKDDPSRILRMDLERGQVVESWGGGLTSGAPVNALQLTEKYANLTHSKEFMGLNKNQLLRMDPRSKEFIVQSKKYAAGTRARLEAFATTGTGYIATASENGDIRLFDAVGKNAKTHLPGLGERIIGIDVSEDGNFVLATTEKYLLLVDTRVKGQAKGGFEKSMGKNKPKPIKLSISPQDIAKHRMGAIHFTTAHFNTGTSLERSIVTSSGPFIITWSFRSVKLGRKDCYQIKQFQDNVVADQFAYNDDGKIVVTLPHDVTLNSFTPGRVRRSSGGGSGLH